MKDLLKCSTNDKDKSYFPYPSRLCYNSNNILEILIYLVL